MPVTVNADDFGANARINAAIVESFDCGLIDSTTIMANMPGFDEAVVLAHEKGLQTKIGAHLVLTEGQPLTEKIREIPILFQPGKSNRRRMLKKLFTLNSYEKKLIYVELSAQIERIRAHEIPISHLDTHHQIHDIWPISQVLTRLLKSYRIPSMRILNNLESSSLPYKNWYRMIVNKYLTYQALNRTNYFGSRVDYLNASQSLEFTSELEIEVMVHPDYDESGLLIDRFNNRKYPLDFRLELLN